jgi:hypothetical protein
VRGSKLSKRRTDASERSTTARGSTAELAQELEEQVAQPIGSLRAALHDHDLAVAIDHESRRAFGVAVQQPARAFGCEQALALAQREAARNGRRANALDRARSCAETSRSASFGARAVQAPRDARAARILDRHERARPRSTSDKSSA